METAPQQNKQTYRVSIFGALAGVLVAFLAGVFVGLHPSWIPVKTSSFEDTSGPVKLPAPATVPAQIDSTTIPQTEPAKTGN